MAKRGRPKGRKAVFPGCMWAADVLAVFTYNEARKGGAKHDAAIDQAITVVQSKYSEAHISRGQMTRLLSRYQPKGPPLAYTVTESLKMMHHRGGEAPKLTKVLTLGMGPRPQHPRANAAGNQE